MAIEAKKLNRVFSYNGMRLPDPDSKMAVESVRLFYSSQYGELLNATTTGPTAEGDNLVYHWQKEVGKKG